MIKRPFVKLILKHKTSPSNLDLLLKCDIQQITIYVVGSIGSLSEAWQAVKEYFNGIVPPATLLGVAILGHENQLVEIDATIINK